MPRDPLLGGGRGGQELEGGGDRGRNWRGDSGNDPSHDCAPSRPGSPRSLSLGLTQSTHFPASQLRLREGKRFVQGHTACKVAGPGIKHRCKVHVILPSGASCPLNPSPIGSISCSRAGIKAAPHTTPAPGLPREKSGFLLLPTLNPGHTGSRPAVCDRAPGKPCRLQERPPGCTELPLKKKKRRKKDDEKIKGKEEVLFKHRRVVTPGGSLKTNGDFAHPL